jgi:hypothetical protein
MPDRTVFRALLLETLRILIVFLLVVATPQRESRLSKLLQTSTKNGYGQSTQTQIFRD